VVREFEWGFGLSAWLALYPELSEKRDTTEDYVAKLNRVAIAEQRCLFLHTNAPADFELRDSIVRFRSPVESPYAENNLVHAQWFPAKNSKRAVVPASALELAGRRAQCVVPRAQPAGNLSAANQFALSRFPDAAGVASAPTMRFPRISAARLTLPARR